MPANKPMPEKISEEMVLAAIDRAIRHSRLSETADVLLATVKEHLGLPRHGGATRQLRPTWDALERAGLIECSRRHSLTLWKLTSAGKKHLEAATPASLPESPQHRNWREARQAAAQHIDRLRDELGAALSDASELLDADSYDSAKLHETGNSLQRACAHLGSATYCLSEWAEPDDAQADVPADHAGRRNYRAWAAGRDSGDDPAMGSET